MKKERLISVDITTGTFNQHLNRILELAKSRISSYVCFCNVHMTIEAYNDNLFKEVVNSADLVCPDGLPLVKGLAWINDMNQDRISGPDMLPELLREASFANLKVLFYGSTNIVLDKIDAFCQVQFPNLKVVGLISPPFRKLTDDEQTTYINKINESEANIVFVALGCPKQEKWMASMKGKINAVMLGVGGAFPMLVGIEKRAPIWMQKSMLEWLFRLIQDPKRLFKRYFVTNTTFIFLLIRAKIYSMLR